MSICLIGLGANVGRRQETLEAAIQRLAREPDVRLVARSAFRATRSIGGPPDQEPFLNGAVLVETSREPEALLAVLQAIEAALGRRRGERWAPRTIDLDLLLYDERVLHTPTLVVPHPRMAWRRFVLEPAAEIAPEMVHPPTGWSLGRLWAHLNTAANYVALAGPIAVGKTEAARAVAERSGARLLLEEPDWAQLEAFYRDPASNGWTTEVKFLDQRSRLLAAGAAIWSDPSRLVVGDFWFDQSLAFARVWLPVGQWDTFHRRWEEARGPVIRPKLIVLLDALAEDLRQRVLDRGRPCERDLDAQQLERIREAIQAQTVLPDQGPVLHLINGPREKVLEEILAAVEAMR